MITDARTQINSLEERSEIGISLIRKGWIGQPATNLSEMLNELEAHGFVVGSEGENIEIGDFIFIVKNDSIREVKYFNP